MLDFGTELDQPGEGYRAFSALEVDAPPITGRRQIYEARWVGNPYRSRPIDRALPERIALGGPESVSRSRD
ncbi:MAG: hypothetical protein AAF628_22695 [Planctomycetota bacterium]